MRSPTSTTLAEYLDFPDDPGEFRVHLLDNRECRPVIFTYAEWLEYHRDGGLPEMSLLEAWHSLPRVEIVPEPVAC